MSYDYPKSFFLELANNDNLLGRITVFLDRERFNIEVDIVLRESRKIYKHVKNSFGYEDEQDAVDQGVSILSHYLKSLKH
jgi:hypothetical protein